MKKILMTVCMLLLISLLLVSVVACNDNGGEDTDYTPNEYEVAKYTVTFNANGDVEMSNNVITDIMAGSIIAKPSFVPVKKGHDFAFWSSDGSTAFDFESTPINSNLTINAIFKAKLYQHTAMFNSKLVYDAENDTYSVIEKGLSKDDVTISSPLTSTYNTSSNLNVPKFKDGVNEKFCFWYYIQDGKPVQFSKKLDNSSSSSTPTSVAMLNKYTLTEPLILYAMYESDLPTVKVNYYDGENLLHEGGEYSIADYVPSVDAYNQDTKTSDNGNTYVFDSWYYQLEDEDGNKVPYAFEFYETGKSATALMGATSTTDYFSFGKTLNLYAKWQRTITISSLEDYQELYNAVKVASPSEEQQANIDEILGAKITIASNIDFANNTFEPLFDEERAFHGVIDGGTYDGEGKVIAKITLSNGTFSGYTHSSIFGYVNGDILNINTNNVLLGAKQNDGVENLIYVGTLATKISGELSNSMVTMPAISLSDMKGVVFGGVVAMSSGAKMQDISVTLPSFNMSGESLVFGGIVGMTDASSEVLRSSASVTIDSVVANDDNIPANGKGKVTLGGMVGSNGGKIELCKISSLRVVSLLSDNETNIGGIIGINSGDVKTSAVQTFELCSQDAQAQVGVNASSVMGVGGMVGRNEGAIVNCYGNANIYVTVLNGNGRVAVGGLVGNNFSDKKDTSASSSQGVCVITTSYATGTLSVNASESGVSIDVASLVGRNSHNKISSCFAIVDVAVVNSTSGTNNIGNVVGKLEKTTAGLKSSWYSSDNKITLNGSAYIVEKPLATEKGEDKANFSSSTWLYDASNTGFSNKIWEVVGENALPTLQDLV